METLKYVRLLTSNLVEELEARSYPQCARALSLVLQEVVTIRDRDLVDDSPTVPQLHALSANFMRVALHLINTAIVAADPTLASISTHAGVAASKVSGACEEIASRLDVA